MDYTNSINTKICIWDRSSSGQIDKAMGSHLLRVVNSTIGSPRAKQAFFFFCSFCCKIFWNSLIKLWIEWVVPLVPILTCISASSCPLTREVLSSVPVPKSSFAYFFSCQRTFLIDVYLHVWHLHCIGSFHQWYLLHTPAELYLWGASCEWIAIKTIQE